MRYGQGPSLVKCLKLRVVCSNTTLVQSDIHNIICEINVCERNTEIAKPLAGKEIIHLHVVIHTSVQAGPPTPFLVVLSSWATMTVGQRLPQMIIGVVSEPEQNSCQLHNPTTPYVDYGKRKKGPPLEQEPKNPIWSERESWEQKFKMWTCKC